MWKEIKTINTIVVFTNIRGFTKWGENIEVFRHSPNEELRETPEVHVAGFCIKEEVEGIKILIAKRGMERRLYPSLFEGCGGQLKYSESFVGVTRHFRCEMNITVKVLENVHQFYSIVQPKEPYIPGIVFLCKHIEGIPNSQNHEEITWVSEQELLDMDAALFIPGVKAEILKLVEMYKNRNWKFAKGGKYE